MTPEEFVAEFEGDQFPSFLGQVIDMFSHDPPFKKAELRKMHKAGIIVLNEVDWTYRLTLKALIMRNED